MKEKISKLVNAAWFPGILILLVLSLFSVIVFPGAEKVESVVGVGTVEVEVTGFHNDTGQALICLYTAGPFTDRQNIMQYRMVRIVDRKATAKFSGMPLRDYALLAFHDENMNNDHDLTPERLPAEGIGVSGMTAREEEMPDFDEAKFTLAQETRSEQLQVFYWD